MMSTVRRIWTALLMVGFGGAVSLGIAPGAAAAEISTALDTVTVTTVPAIPNMSITFAGTTALTDAAGQVVFLDPNPAATGSLPAKMSSHTFETTLDGVPVRVEPARYIQRGRTVLMTVDVYWQISLTYVNGSSPIPVDSSQISSVTLRNSIGQEVIMTPDEKVWVQGSRVVPLHGSWENKHLQYNIQQVDYQGTNVVNASQQRFFPAETQSFEVKLLFFSVGITVGDGLFGFPVGTSVNLTYPDEHVENFPVDDKGFVLVPSVPRGTYSLTVLGSGLKLVQPLAVSRDSEIRVKLYTWLDVLLLALAGVVFIVVTIYLGLRNRRAHRAKLRSSATHPDAADAPPHQGAPAGDLQPEPALVGAPAAAQPIAEISSVSVSEAHRPSDLSVEHTGAEKARHFRDDSELGGPFAMAEMDASAWTLLSTAGAEPHKPKHLRLDDDGTDELPSRQAVPGLNPDAGDPRMASSRFERVVDGRLNRVVTRAKMWRAAR